MTDPTPNNPPMPEPLSPAAQAVLDAALFEVNVECYAPWIAAAVLRAAADQTINVQRSVEMWELHQKFHAIATELENHQ